MRNRQCVRTLTLGVAVVAGQLVAGQLVGGGWAAPAYGAEAAPTKVQRIGRLAKIAPEAVERYKMFYAENGADLTKALAQYNIRNASLWIKELTEGEPYLFAYLEYTGDNLASDMDEMALLKVGKKSRAADADALLAFAPAEHAGWVAMEEVFFDAGAADVAVEASQVRRIGQVIGVRPEWVESYKYIHANPWPEVMAAIKRGNIRNYPIYLSKIGEAFYIFGYMEYVGKDFDADMAEVDGDPATQAWIKFTDEVCQLPISTRKEGEWWANMDEIYQQK